MGLGDGEATALAAGPIGEIERIAALGARQLIESQASGRDAVASAPAASIIAAKRAWAAASRYCSSTE